MTHAARRAMLFHGVLGIMIGATAAFIGWQLHPAGVWLGLLPVLLFGWLSFRKLLLERRVARQTFPGDWRRWLQQHVPFYRSLDSEAQTRFERRVLLFLQEHRFEGVGEVEVTDELRLSIAAGAALLLHGRPEWDLPATRTILFYPDRFDEDYLFEDTEAAIDGMVHGQGPVIFSAPAVLESWAYPDDGSNVVLHELAHLLDFKNAVADGVPNLLDPASEEAWSRLVRREMRAALLGKSLLRRYAATNPAEFFAVAVENFFERPGLLRKRHPELYEAMAAFFNMDLCQENA